jgi:hypothetical protein
MRVAWELQWLNAKIDCDSSVAISSSLYRIGFSEACVADNWAQVRAKSVRSPVHDIQ